MTPLGLMVAGWGLVALDFRIDGLDLLPDLIGWAFVLVGLIRVADRSQWFGAAAFAAAFGLVLGIPLLVAEAGPVLSTLCLLGETVVVFGTCTGIREVVGRSRVREAANLLRWADLAISVVALVMIVLVGPVELTAVGAAAIVPVVLVTLAALAVMVGFLIFLWTNRQDAALQPRSLRQGLPG
jgi:hypothetical protein